MYEIKCGTASLVFAMFWRKDDPAVIKKLAYLLNYHEDSLPLDIQATTDFFITFADKP